jgi:hypothetical protein
MQERVIWIISVSVKICLVDRYLRTTIYSQWLLYTYLKWYVTWKSTRIRWRRMCTFITTVCKTKLDLHVQFCNTDLFRKSVVNTGIRSYNKVPVHVKKLDKIKSFNRELRSCFYKMHFIQWMNLRHIDCTLTVWVCEFDKLSYLSVLIGIDIITLHYIILYFIVFDVDVLWVWVIVIYKLYSDFLHVPCHKRN